MGKIKCTAKARPQWCVIADCNTCPFGEILENMEEIPEDIQKVVDEDFYEML